MTQGAGDLLQSYTESHHTEKIYVHSDKQYYLPEEIIYGKVYHVHGQDHRLIDTSVLIHIELWDSSGVLINDLLVRTSDGQASFTIETSLGYEPGLYTLKAYTQYQKNFAEEYLFHKQVAIITKPDQLIQTTNPPNESISIDFYPEGGYLIDNLPSIIAYKIKGTTVTGDLSAYIISDIGDTIQMIKPVVDGYGSFSLTPTLGIDYYAQIMIHGKLYRYKLPTILSTGVVINAYQLDSFITLQSTLSDDLINKKLSIVGHIRGEVFLDATFTKHTLFKLLSTELPSGVLHFTVFDHHLNPIAERLVFNENPLEKIDLSITLDQSKQSTRSQLKGSISSQSTEKINGSLTIYSDELIASKLRGIDIHNYLLLQSDLRGPVLNLHQFFKKDKNGQSNIDLLMRTHGWRRFDWQEVLVSATPDIKYPAETSSMIAGKVSLLRNDKPVKADVLMTLLDQDEFVYQRLTTNDDGLFFFSGLNLNEATDIFIQAAKFNHKKSKKKDPHKWDLHGNRLVEIDLLDVNTPAINKGLSLPAFSITPVKNSLAPSNPSSDHNAYRQKSSNQSTIFDGALWSIDLENVTISSSVNKAQKRNLETKRRYREKNMVFFSSTEKFDPNEEQFKSFDYKNVYQMINNIIPSIQLSYNSGLPQLNNGNAQIVLDGYIIPVERALLIDPNNIKMIDHWLPGPKPSVVYGVNEAVVLLSKNQNEVIRSPKSGLVVYNSPGYHQARRYASPDYTLESLDRPDLRTTILWDADVVVDQDPYPFIFNTSDIIGDFSIEFEGINSMGVPVTKHLSITVK